VFYLLPCGIYTLQDILDSTGAYTMFSKTKKILTRTQLFFRFENESNRLYSNCTSLYPPSFFRTNRKSRNTKGGTSPPFPISELKIVLMFALHCAHILCLFVLPYLPRHGDMQKMGCTTRFSIQGLKMSLISMTPTF